MSRPTAGSIKQFCDPSVCPSVSLFHAPIVQQRLILGLSLTENTNKKPHYGVEPTGQRGRTVTGSG